MTLANARDEVERQRQIVKEHGSAEQFRDADAATKRARLTARVAADERTGYTVRRMVDAYLKEASDRLKGWRDVDRALGKYVMPELGDKPAHALMRADVVAMLDRLNKKGRHVMANRVLAYFRRCCNWAVVQEKLPANLCAMIERKWERPKGRHLSDAEIHRFLANLSDFSIDGASQDLYRLTLRTGMRPGEAAARSINQFDVEERTVRLEDTKNRRRHVVPLSPQALVIVKRRRGDGQWLFPGKHGPKRHVRGDSFQAPLRKALPTLKILPTTPHDLRRSCANGLARMGRHGSSSRSR